MATVLCQYTICLNMAGALYDVIVACLPIRMCSMDLEFAQQYSCLLPVQTGKSTYWHLETLQCVMDIN